MNYFDLDCNVATAFSDKFGERHESVISILTHVNLQSCNNNIALWYSLHVSKSYVLRACSFDAQNKYIIS